MSHAKNGSHVGSLGGVLADVDALIGGHDLVALDLETAESEALFSHGGGHTSASIVFEDASPSFVLEGLGFGTGLVSTTLATTALSSTALSTALAALLTTTLSALLSAALPSFLRRLGFRLRFGNFLSAGGRLEFVLGKVGRSFLFLRARRGFDLAPSPWV